MISSLTTGLILFLAVSFFVYGVICLVSVEMKNEFKRFGLEKFPELIGILEIVGSIGLIVGIYVPWILLLSSGGLAFLMFMALIFRFRAGDTLWQSSPATLFLILTGYLFAVALNLTF